LKADWRVGCEHALGEIENKSGDRDENESARGETQKTLTMEEMEKGVKHRSEKVALEIYGKAAAVILAAESEKGGGERPFQLKATIGEHERRDGQGNGRGVARHNQWGVLAQAAKQMTDEEFGQRRDLASQFSNRQMPVEPQNDVALMRQLTRQEEAEGPNVFLGRVIASEKGAASVRAHIEGRGKWASKVEANEQGQERLKQNLETIRSWASDLQGLLIPETRARYLVDDSETCKYAKEIPLWARAHIRLKAFADAKNWNGVNFCAADVGILNYEKMADIVAPTPKICLGRDIYSREYEEGAKAENKKEFRKHQCPHNALGK
jgi:hypothetical protein